MFENQPKGLWILSLANTGERFGYYTMLAVFALFLGENFGFSAGTASEIYTGFLTAVYFLPLIGGMAADKWGSVSFHTSRKRNNCNCSYGGCFIIGRSWHWVFQRKPSSNDWRFV